MKQKYSETREEKWNEFCEAKNIQGDEDDFKFGDHDEIESELNLDFHLNYMKDYTLKQSISSFNLSEVENFVYGPFPSRFWLLRKHILHLDKSKLKNESPFLGWDCVTLQIENKWNVHLIIPNQKAMSNFLRLLIWNMKTVDGQRGSSK